MTEDIYQASLKYHAMGRPGKLEVIPTKPCTTQRDLSLAYSPGVAEPCREIAKHPDDVFKYTNKGNLVAVISNGTAVLGLGNIGAAAGKPVMEGKGVLFKRFADIDVFDIEVSTEDPDRFIDAVAAIGVTFGGINLEDIKSPECFYIEPELQKRLDIPVFHDDQHGTAIIAGAAVLNACEVTGRKIDKLKLVVNGAGAAGLSVTRYLVKLGVRKENIIMCDRFGVIHKGRNEPGLDASKMEFAADTSAETLADAMKGADCFVGCSVGNVVTPQMLRGMADNPIVFAMANPTPEIDYPEAVAARDDVIMATGRSDYPNQVNNVLGFPFIFRGALDCHARSINEDMKLAATRALARLAKEDVPEIVSRAYGGEHYSFGRNYLIPKPFDPRVLYWVSVAVAEAAIASGAARTKLDIDEYRESLRRKVDAGRNLVSVPLQVATRSGVRIAVPEANQPRLANALRQIVQQQLCEPVLIGPEKEIRKAMEGIANDRYSIEDPEKCAHIPQLIEVMRRQRPFDTLSDEYCRKELKNPFALAAVMVEAGLCDGMISASNRNYGEMVRPVLGYVSRRRGVSRVAGMHMVAIKSNPLFIADTALIPDPSAEELAEIALRASRVVKRLNITPRIAFISYANYSSREDNDISKLRRASRIVRRLEPDIVNYGDVQADVALDPVRFRDALDRVLPNDPANILIFPNLHAANAGFRLARVLSGGTALGPLLLGLKRPCNILPRGTTEDEFVDMMAITAYNALRRKKELTSGKQTMVTSRDQHQRHDTTDID